MDRVYAILDYLRPADLAALDAEGREFTDIRNVTGIPEGTLRWYLQNLQKLGMVRRDRGEASRVFYFTDYRSHKEKVLNKQRDKLKYFLVDRHA